MPLIQIDDTTKPEYSYLRAEDRCFYQREYAAGESYANPTNQLIFNLKKCPTRAKTSPQEYAYKGRAIGQIARELCADLGLPNSRLDTVVFVPIPPSKPIGHPKYDNRLEQILARPELSSLRTAAILHQTTETVESHNQSSGRLNPDQRRELYTVQEIDLNGMTEIILFDDVITTGAHFVAASDLLKERLGLPVTGLFVARTLHRQVDFESMFPDLL